MKQIELRKLIHNSAQRSFRICMDNGKKYVVSNPDFAIAARNAVILASGPGHDFGPSFVICDFDHISRLELPAKPKSKSKTRPS